MRRQSGGELGACVGSVGLDGGKSGDAIDGGLSRLPGVSLNAYLTHAFASFAFSDHFC